MKVHFVKGCKEKESCHLMRLSLIHQLESFQTEPENALMLSAHLCDNGSQLHLVIVEHFVAHVSAVCEL